MGCVHMRACKGGGCLGAFRWQMWLQTAPAAYPRKVTAGNHVSITTISNEQLPGVEYWASKYQSVIIGLLAVSNRKNESRLDISNSLILVKHSIS